MYRWLGKWAADFVLSRWKVRKMSEGLVKYSFAESEEGGLVSGYGGDATSDSLPASCTLVYSVDVALLYART